MIRALLVLLLLPVCARAGTVEITVDNVRAATGHMRVAVCAPAEFTKPSCTYAGAADAAAPQTVVRIDGVAPGTYAAQGYLDEHDWKELRRTLLGRPKEGVGFSRDAPFRFGPPDFADAAFAVPATGVAHVKMTLRYYD